MVEEFGFLWADLKSIFENGSEHIVVTMHHPATSCLAMHGAGGISVWSYVTQRGDVCCIR